MANTPNVTHNADAGQFEARTEHGVAVLKYAMRGDALDLAHTTVPQEAEGQGVGSALAKAALDHARREHVKVIPSCPFVASYLKNHQEYADLVAPR
jgi:predicted GNAT family acetyltransferase